MTLARLIEQHRGHYADDLHISRLVSRQPPTSLDLNTGVLHQEPAAAIGMTMAGRLLKYVGHPEGYGSDFPWAKALWLLRVECRRRHYDHRGDTERTFWRGSLCHEAVKLVVIGGESRNIGPLSPEAAGRILRIDRIDEILARAFRFIEERMDDFRAAAEQRAKEDEGRALVCRCGHSWSRHDDPAGLFRCTSCDCRRYNADAQAA